MPAAFTTGTAELATGSPGLRFEMSRVGDEFFETAIRKTPSGEQRMTSRIDLIYGAGAGTDEIYFTWRSENLYELPVAWLPPLNEWGASAFDPYAAGDFSREVTLRCLECHNTHFEHYPGTLNRYRRENSILGVSCESCHGPGRDHAAFHEERPQADSPEAIVHPGRLSRELQMDLCASCHSNALKNRGPAFQYRPGEPLDSYYATVRSKYPEDDHVANQTKYLRESKCFQLSDTLTCTTCHNPHRPRAESAGFGRSACLSCHETMACNEQHRLPEPVRENCVGCHMPQGAKIQVSFRTKDDVDVAPVKRWEHRIGIYPVARDQVLLAWHRGQDNEHSRNEAARLTRSLNQHWLAEAQSCRRDFRFLAALESYRQAYRLDPTPETRAKLDEVIETREKYKEDMVKGIHSLRQNQPAEAIESFRASLELKPDDALAHGRLGTAYAATGQTEAAIEHLKAAEECDPDDPYAPGMLGWLAYLAGRPQEALEHYERAAKALPFDAKLAYQTGLALVALGRWPEAEERFRETLRIDPNHAGGSQGLSHALSKQGRSAEALTSARRAAKLTNFKNPDILITLADAYAAVGRFEEASETAAKALAAASGNTKTISGIRARLDSFRQRARQQAEKPE